jgi:nucleotide sugar dehydrogenase
VDTACCPDRSLSGRSFLDQFAHPNVVGGLDPASTSRAAALFAPLGPVLEVSTPEAAEAVKLFANVQRDTAFALANQMALICEELGLDFFEIATAGSEGYPRFAAVRPGPVGGPCLSKDAFLMAASVAAPERLATLPLAARAINQSLLDHVAGVLADFAAARGHRDLVIAVLGLAFKGEPITMDRRGSFGVALSARLRADFPGAIVRAFDPASSAAGEAQNLAEALQDADVAILANDHPALTQLDLAEAAATLRPGGLMYDVCGAMRAGARRLPNGVVYRAFGNASADEPNVVSAGLSRKA